MLDLHCRTQKTLARSVRDMCQQMGKVSNKQSEEKEELLKIFMKEAARREELMLRLMRPGRRLDSEAKGTLQRAHALLANKSQGMALAHETVLRRQGISGEREAKGCTVPSKGGRAYVL